MIKFEKNLSIIMFILLLGIIFCFASMKTVENANAEAMHYELETFSGDLPESYTSPYQSSIKNQGDHGYCWIFAAMSTLESNLKAMGYENPNSEDGYFDLSEEYFSQLATIWCDECDSKCIYDVKEQCYICPKCGKKISGYTRLQDDGDFEGGYEEWVIGYLMSGYGPIYEQDFPYDPEINITERVDAGDFEKLFQVTDIVLIDPTDADALKRGIIDYGALNFSYLHNNQAMDWADENITLGSTKIMPDMGAHAVTLVGYDDNYDKNNFVVHRDILRDELQYMFYETPPEFMYFMDLYGLRDLEEYDNLTEEEFNLKFFPQNDGAWLIKNSWGSYENFFDGYCWISYEDAGIYNCYPDSKAFAVTGIEVNPNKEITMYQLDEAGAIEYRSPKNEIDARHYAVANVFDFDSNKNSRIDHITFATENGKGSSYNIYYSKVKENGEISASFDEMVLLKKGSISHNGYETINFDENIVLPRSRGAIVMDISSRNKDINFGLDCTFYDWYMYSNKTIQNYYPVINENESFLIYDGKLYEPYKAYGKDANFSLKIGTISTNKEVSFAKASFANIDSRLEEIEDLSLSKNDYTEESWEEYQNILTAINNLKEDEALTIIDQSTLDEALQELNIAIGNLSKITNENAETIEQNNRNIIISYMAAFFFCLTLVLLFNKQKIKHKRRKKTDKKSSSFFDDYYNK